jgi:hypothetical protein
MYSWYDSLDGGSVRRKAASCTQDSTKTYMPWVGFEPTIEQAKTDHGLGRTATVVDLQIDWEV